jgi:NAD(P)-dependent dehydrogenase (short-subunit alcohol dehydrogenase family)
MKKRFENKKALITGSSRGLGKAIAVQLAMEGAEVVIHYNEQKKEAESVRKKIVKLKGKAHLLQADLTDYKNAICLGEQAWKLMGAVDLLVNNAGISYKKSFLETSLEDVNRFTNINFKSTLFLTQTIAKRMIAENIDGSIYTITSINAIQPGIGFSAYGATKGALETLMKGVALELAPYGIKINTLAVGAIQTDINATVWQDPEKLKVVNDSIPFGRLGQPEEIAKLLCGLFESNSYMTGSTLVVDGGWLLKHGYEKNRK